jgi:hypothetical protein
MTESKVMSNAIRKAAGRGEAEEQPEVAAALASLAEDTATIREGVAGVLEGLEAINSKLDSLAGEKSEKSEEPPPKGAEA